VISRVRALAVAIAAGATTLAGCANFSEHAAPRTWHPPPSLHAEDPPAPEVPGLPGPPTGAPATGSPSSVPPPNGCTDYNPAVIATCLDQVSAVATLPSPGPPSGLAAERTTGNVLRVTKGSDPTQVAHLNVDPTGGGGLTGLALSARYVEDQLVYAYITTGTDNRVVRISPGSPPQPVLTGIPRGATHNAGALAVDPSGALLVATGDAGKPSAASDPASLAGKVLRIDEDGNPAEGNPTPGSRVIASGLHSPGGLCTSANGKRRYVTDRAPDAGLLYEIAPGEPLHSPTWRWPDKPGVAGCVAFPHVTMVAAAKSGGLRNVFLNPDGSVRQKPTKSLNGKNGFGRLAGMDRRGTKYALAGTVNKAPGGDPVSSDDRVVVITTNSAGSAPGRD
jgi:glucose/arabinose dehydrogenase